MKSSRLFALWGIVALGSLGVVACDDDDNGTGPDNEVTAPTNVQAVVDGTTATITWSPVTNADSYDVLVTHADEEDRTTRVTAAQAQFPGLSRGETYQVVVTAVNEDDEASSSPVGFDVPMGVFDQAEQIAFFQQEGFENIVADPNLPDEAFTIGTQGSPPNVIPTSMPAGYTPVPAAEFMDGDLVMPADGRTLQDTDYAGAVEPGTPLADAWYAGWTAWATDGSDSRPGADETALPIVEVEDDIVADTEWTNDNVYLLQQPIFVGVDCGTDGSAAGCTPVTLTIEPGTTILGETDLPQGIRGAYLIISRGSRIVADANANRADPNARPNPDDVIVFTSANDRGDRDRGDWGGLVVNGRAPTNAGDEAQGEGDSGFYGGTDDMDDSGILRGVRVEFAGDDVTPADQLNGIAFQGVGAGTTVDYVQVLYNVDDGTEPFGGSVSQTHMVLTGIGDDSLDGTDGYRGFVQFAVIQQRADDADQGLELSNNGDDEDAGPPYSAAVVANVTAIGARESMGSGEISDLGGESDHGILLREGAFWKVYNSIVVGFGSSGFCIEGVQAALNAAALLDGSGDPGETLDARGLILFGNVEPNSTEPEDNVCSGG